MRGAVGRRVSTPSEFRSLVEPLVGADEARHTVMLGVLDAIERTPQRYPQFVLWVVEQDGRTQAAALRTPPYHAVVAQPLSAEALDELARVMHEESPDLPGVNGLRPQVDDFGAAWACLSGGSAVERMRLILHRLERLEEVPVPPGLMRAAAPGDRPLLIEWMRAFAVETGVQGGADELEKGIDGRLGEPLGLMVWEDDGAVVSIAGSVASSPGCGRVGPVYTPPELRGRGYATALVRELTAARLAAGARTMVLYTDVANPTSNAIYRRIGYEPLCEAVELDFEPGPAGAG
jgi:predicted GNAT family acetyltransferase